MPKRQSAASRETVAVEVKSLKLGQYVDPTRDSLQMAFLPEDVVPPGASPVAGTWQTWTGTDPLQTRYMATCVVGPGGAITLTPGEYKVWVHPIDSPDAPWLEADTLTVY